MSMHEGLPVAGYQPQSQAKVDAVNVNKRLEEELLRVLDALRLNEEVDLRWLAIARTHIETGFMCLNRAIFQPLRLKD